MRTYWKTVWPVALFWVLFLLGMSIYAWADGTLPAVLTWHNTDNTMQVQVEKSAASTGPFELLTQLSPGTITYTDATNAPGQKACYRLRYFNGAAQGSPTTAKCKTFSLTPTVKPSSEVVQ